MHLSGEEHVPLPLHTELDALDIPLQKIFP
jgi:hypothetical protein